MKLEAGKTYKTRDGRIYGPLVKQGSGFICHVVPAEYNAAHAFMWYPDGRFYQTKPLPVDLIEEYVAPLFRQKTEINQGKFGPLHVCPHEPGSVLIGIDTPFDICYKSFTAADLREAIFTMTRLAEFLESDTL